MLEVSISSTRPICDFWGLIGSGSEQARQCDPAPARRNIVTVPAAAKKSETSALSPKSFALAVPDASKGVGKVIEDALKAAGLMR